MNNSIVKIFVQGFHYHSEPGSSRSEPEKVQSYWPNKFSIPWNTRKNAPLFCQPTENTLIYYVYIQVYTSLGGKFYLGLRFQELSSSPKSPDD